MSKQLDFYDMKNKKGFVTSDYVVKVVDTTNGVRKQAITISPGGTTCSRFVPDKFKK